VPQTPAVKIVPNPNIVLMFVNTVNGYVSDTNT